jgi:hypothetical protein
MKKRLARVIRQAALFHLSIGSCTLSCGADTVGSAGLPGSDAAPASSVSGASVASDASDAPDTSRALDASAAADASAELDTSPASDASDAAGMTETAPPPTCTISPQSATVVINCEGQFAFDGRAAECGLAQSFGGAQCTALCPPFNSMVADYCTLDDGPPSTLSCDYPDTCGPMGTGRRPRGLRRIKAKGDRSLSRYLSETTHLEAASVFAFARLARELTAHGAPVRLRDRALAAARDEERHARVVGALATERGGVIARVRVETGRTRTLRAIAIENAVEGCVHESFGAAVAVVQAQTAADPAVRTAYRRIARDELRHAELAWDVARWLDTRLTSADRARVLRARRRAATACLASSGREPEREMVETLGVPAARVARAIALELAATVWAHA